MTRVLDPIHFQKDQDPQHWAHKKFYICTCMSYLKRISHRLKILTYIGDVSSLLFGGNLGAGVCIHNSLHLPFLPLNFSGDVKCRFDRIDDQYVCSILIQQKC